MNLEVELANGSSSSDLRMPIRLTYLAGAAMKWHVGAILFLICISAHAVEPAPKHVFVKADCSGPLGAEAVTSLKEAIRRSAGYQLASTLVDDGGYGVVLTVFLECSESVLRSKEAIISIASIFGTAVCDPTPSCIVTNEESSLEASLCSGNTGTECGRDLYLFLDQWMDKEGESWFRRRVEAGQKKLSG